MSAEITTGPGAVADPTRFEQAPSVVGGDLRRVLALTWTLATTDFKLRFYGSVLGYAWTLVRPFAFFGVIYVVFALIVKAGQGIEGYPAYILLSIVLFGFFDQVVSTCLSSLVTRENLLRKMRFPRLVIPMAALLGAIFELGLTFSAVLIFLLISGIYPDPSWLQLIPLVLILGIFATGLGLLLSVLFVRFRDIRPIWDVTGQMLFYASPILYVATMVPVDYQSGYLLNPLAAVMTQMRHAVIDGNAPTVFTLIGEDRLLVIPAALVLGAFALGVSAFRREAPRVAENL